MISPREFIIAYEMLEIMKKNKKIPKKPKRQPIGCLESLYINR